MPTPRTPRFTRSHFDWIARVIAELNDDDSISHEDVRSLFANELLRTSPRFDVGRFLLACQADPTGVSVPRPPRSRPRTPPLDAIAVSTPAGPHDQEILQSYVYNLEEIADSPLPPWSRPTPTAGEGWEFVPVHDTISREHETNLDNDHGDETTGEWRPAGEYAGVSVAPVHRYNFRRRVAAPTPPAPAPEYRIQSEGWRYLNQNEPLDRSQDQVDPRRVGMSGDWSPIADDDWVSPGPGEESLFRRPYRPYRIVPRHPHLRYLEGHEAINFETDLYVGGVGQVLGDPEPLRHPAWEAIAEVFRGARYSELIARPLYRPVPGHDGWRYLEPGEVPIAGQDRIVSCWEVCLGVSGPDYTVEFAGPADACRGIEFFARQLTFPPPHSAGLTPPQVNTFYGVHPARSTRPIRPLPLP